MEQRIRRPVGQHDGVLRGPIGKRARRIAMGAVVLWQLGAGPAVATPPPPEQDLTSGQIQVSNRAHPGTKVRWGRAVGVVEAPAEAVMGVVSDYASYQEFMPHFRKSKVLAQRGGKALVYMEAKIAKGTMTVWAQLKIRPQTDGDKQVVLASMTKGNLDHMEARWEVQPLDAKRSLVTFEILVDPKVPLPSGLVSTENEKASKSTIRALRKRLTQAS